MASKRPRTDYSPWKDPRIVQADVDTNLLALFAHAEAAEQKRIDEGEDFSGSFSPYELGGISPLSSEPSTPTTNGRSLSTDDVLYQVDVLLEGEKRKRMEDGEESGPSSAALKTARQLKRVKTQRDIQRAQRQREARTKDTLDAATNHVRPTVERKYNNPLRLRASYVEAALIIARSSDTGLNRPAATGLYNFKQCVEDPQWKYIDIDIENPIAVVIVDRNGWEIIKLVPGPECADWDSCIIEAGELCEEGRRNETRAWAEAEQVHRRGEFTYISSGPTHGNGRMEPGNLKQTHPELVQKLFKTRPFRRMAGHQDACFRHYDPKGYKYCKTHVAKLHAHHTHLKRNFNNSIYTSATVNLGPKSCCCGHCDSNNSVKVRCAVTSMGKFNYKLGGHMVLEDFKIIMDFPPGWTCLIPSASVRHGNTPIQDGETRYSFTQYISGSLIRWVRHGFRLKNTLSEAERSRLDGTAEERLKETFSLLTVRGEYAEDRQLAESLVF